MCLADFEFVAVTHTARNGCATGNWGALALLASWAEARLLQEPASSNTKTVAFAALGTQKLMVWAWRDSDNGGVGRGIVLARLDLGLRAAGHGCVGVACVAGRIIATAA